MMSNKDMP